MASSRAKPLRMRSARGRSLDQRKDNRVPIQLKVDIESPNDHYLFEYSSNLSRNGIFIHTLDPLPAGTYVNIQFLLPDDTPIRTRGMVIWVNTDEDDEDVGMGIKFMGLAEEERDRILNSLKKLAIL